MHGSLALPAPLEVLQELGIPQAPLDSAARPTTSEARTLPWVEAAFGMGWGHALPPGQGELASVTTQRLDSNVVLFQGNKKETTLPQVVDSLMTAAGSQRFRVV